MSVVFCCRRTKSETSESLKVIIISAVVFGIAILVALIVSIVYAPPQVCTPSVCTPSVCTPSLMNPLSMHPFIYAPPQICTTSGMHRLRYAPPQICTLSGMHPLRYEPPKICTLSGMDPSGMDPSGMNPLSMHPFIYAPSQVCTPSDTPIYICRQWHTPPPGTPNSVLNYFGRNNNYLILFFMFDMIMYGPITTWRRPIGER